MLKYYSEDKEIYEIGTDEVGRGPLFGRVYTASVVLPKDDSFNHSEMKDSKKFHSKKKLKEVAEYIKCNAIAWSVAYETEEIIDEINILQATQKSMHKSIIKVRNILLQNVNDGEIKTQLLIDGNYFNPIRVNTTDNNSVFLSHICIKGGDNTYTSIAAASILAKVERDAYIEELCRNNPKLDEFYKIGSNKGYGAKSHMDGIAKHGITQWHRKSFKPCKIFNSEKNDIK